MIRQYIRRTARFIPGPGQLCCAPMQARFLTQFSTDPNDSVATDRFLLARATETRTPCLRVYNYPNDVVLLGRYHPPDGLGDAPDVTTVRRLTGGRVFPAGEGFVQFSLTLPHRAFLLSHDPHAIAPFQVLNRYARGVMAGLKARGIEVFYPGRDLLTVRRRAIGWLSFVTATDDALLCEGGLFVRRDARALAPMLDRIDPRGTVFSRLFAHEEVTTLEEILRSPLPFDQLADTLKNGFTRQYDIEFTERPLDTDERAAIMRTVDRTEPRAASVGHRLRLDLPWEAAASTPIGQLRIRFSLTPERAIQEIRFSGDLIADPAGIDALERGLTGCPLEQRAIWQSIDGTFLDPDHYLIGAGKLEDLPGLILRAQPSSGES